jgi:hypothetical protein
LLPSLTTSISAEEEPNYPRWYQGGPYNPDIEGTLGGNLINFIANKFFPVLGWYNIGSGKAPKYFYSNPSVIEIDYLGNASVNLTWGTEREERKNWHRFQDNIFPEFTLYYEPVFPDNIPKDAFHYILDPPSFDILEYHESVGGNDPRAPQPVTNLTLYLDLPPDPNNPIQDFVLTINVSIQRKYGNLIEEFGLGAIFGGFWNVNYNADIGRKSFEIFVKVKPHYRAEIRVPPLVELSLEDATSAKIEVENRGSHVEQFAFRVKNNAEKFMVNTPPPITLYPGETGLVDVGFITKPMVYDPGTLHSIEIEVYPVDDKNMTTLATGILSVRTKGFALQGIFSFKFSWHLFFASLFIIFILIIYLIIKKIKLSSSFKKPKKPWMLPKEKQHLEKLLKENKKDEYKSTMEMMKQEYVSSLLWYEYYRKSLIKKERKKGKLVIFLINVKNSIFNFFKNLVNKLKIILQERKDKKIKLEEQKPLEEDIKESKTEEIPEFKEAELVEEEDFETKIKDKALRKIRKQQEKQKRKIRRRPLSSNTNNTY